MFVLTMDQRGSRTHGDQVPQLLEALAPFDPVLPFERSVGDEVQGVLADPAAVVAVVARVLREGNWYVGIGLGGIDLPLPASPREAAGSAFVAARVAVEAAKKSGERVPMRVVAASGPASGDSEWAAAAEAVLVLLGDVVRRRSAAEWRVIDALQAAPAATQKDIAAQLKITPQAVSKALFRAGHLEEVRGSRAAALLLGQAAGLDVGPVR